LLSAEVTEVTEVTEYRFVSEAGNNPPSDLWSLTSVDDALDHFRRSFPVSSFTEKIPPLIWRHLLYAIDNLGLRTEIHRRLVIVCNLLFQCFSADTCLCNEQDELVARGTIRLLKLGSTFTETSTAIVFMEDYEKFVRDKHPDHQRLIGEFPYTACLIPDHKLENRLIWLLSR
jgi:hypothetical protein